MTEQQVKVLSEIFQEWADSSNQLANVLADSSDISLFERGKLVGMKVAFEKAARRLMEYYRINEDTCK